MMTGLSKHITLIGAVLVCLMAAAQPAAAQASDPKLLGTFQDWSAYSYREGDNNVCYILSTPKKAVGSYKKRGEIFALVTHRPAEKANNVFSVMAGYSYKSGSNVTLMIDKEKFVLFTHNDSAWAPDPATDARIAAAMQKGKTMTIKGSSSKGTDTTDTYGLRGTAEAFAAINKACGIPK